MIIKRDLSWKGPYRQELVLVAAPSGEERIIHSEDDFEISYPALSPDETTLPYCVGGYDMGNDLVIAEPATGEIRARFPLEDEWDEHAPAWIDNQTLLIGSTMGDYQSFTKVSVEGKMENILERRGYASGHWALTGDRKLAFFSTRNGLTLETI